MEALRSLPLTPNSANVTWKVPFNLALFPPGLEFRAAYQILTTWSDVTVLYVSFFIAFHLSFFHSVDCRQDKCYLNHPSERLSVDFNLFHDLSCIFFSFATQDVEAAQQLDWDPKNLNYQLALTLPYANVDYNVTVWARSTVANKSDDRFWSPAASTIFRTLPDRELLVKDLLFLFSSSSLTFSYDHFFFIFATPFQVLAVHPLRCQTALKYSTLAWSNAL